MAQSITIPPDTLALLREHSNLIENLSDDLPADQPLVLPRDLFSVLTDDQWEILTRLVQEIQVSGPAERNQIAQELNSIFVVSQYAERNHLTVSAIYNIAVAMYEFIGGEDGHLDQLPRIFNLGTHINNLGVLSHRLGRVSAEDFKEMGDYLGFHGGKRKKTRKNKQRKH